jgi:hypothetical protein
MTRAQSTEDESRMFDDYADNRAVGDVIGSSLSGGIVRHGVDVEGVIGIDNGALRIRPLVRPGWGRSGISYGQFSRRNGLSFALWIANGHNTSQAEPPIESLHARMRRWALGSETDRPYTRVMRWIGSRQRKLFWRTLLQWLRTNSRLFRSSRIDENLALGWFSIEAPTAPTVQGHALVMHALGAECGELWASVAGVEQRTVPGLQNVPLYFLVVLRDQGAAYYVSTIPKVPSIPAWPLMKLIAIDPSGVGPSMFAGIHQSVLGQIGFRVDTRVQASRVEVISEFESWFGSADGADTLSGVGSLDASVADTGQQWLIAEGAFARTENGVVGAAASNLAILMLQRPIGFVRVQVRTTYEPGTAAIIWRAINEDNYWCFEVGTHSCHLWVKERGRLCKLPGTRMHRLEPSTENSVQIADDGQNIRLYLNSALVYSSELSDARLAHGQGVGIQAVGGSSVVLSRFEAHPREIRVPESVILEPPWLAEGREIVVRDDFDRAPSDLEGTITSHGQQRWSRSIGSGQLWLTGERSVRVRASVQRPSPGRTAYTVPWSSTSLADVTVNITPPGRRRGEGEQGRGGLIFWQDERNYITLSLWMNDSYGFSVSSFFYIDGYEELYDAVWTNIGQRVHWGVPFDFRVVFDGNHYMASVNSEPVLHRALTDVYPDQESLSIRRVGMVANWEWGNDTGSLFREFVGRA